MLVLQTTNLDGLDNRPRFGIAHKKINKIVEFLFESGWNPVRNLILGGVQEQFLKKMPKKSFSHWSLEILGPPQAEYERACLHWVCQFV